MARGRELTRRYRRALSGVEGIRLPFSDEDVEHNACYVMPVAPERPGLLRPLRRLMLDPDRVQTSTVYPASHEFSAYQGADGSLARSELWARTQVNLPPYPHLTDAEQDRVVDALTARLAEVANPPAAPAGRER